MVNDSFEKGILENEVMESGDGQVVGGDVEFQGGVSQERLSVPPAPLTGLGGWLVLVGFGRVITPFQIIFVLFTDFQFFFMSGALEELSSTLSPAYSKLWVPLSIFELGMTIVALVLHSILLYTFFAKKRSFPKLFIYFNVGLFLVAVLDALLLEYMQSTMAYDLGLDTIGSILQPFVGIAIWVPYMLKSVRVKNTFVK